MENRLPPFWILVLVSGCTTVLLWITDVLIEQSNRIMVTGNKFSTFSLRCPSQTDSYYLRKDPGARVGQSRPIQLSKPIMEWKVTTASHFYGLSRRTDTTSVYVCMTQKGEARKRSKWNNSSLFMSNQIGTFLPFPTVQTALLGKAI